MNKRFRASLRENDVNFIYSKYIMKNWAKNKFIFQIIQSFKHEKSIHDIV